MAFGSHMVGRHSNLSMYRTRRPLTVNGKPMARIIGIISILLLAGNSAFAQFMVNPMTVVVSSAPGREAWTQVSINNTQEVSHVIDLRLVDLTQGSDGTWDHIEVDDPRADSPELRSCRSWLWLPQESVELPPGQRAPVRLRIRIPRGTGGYHFAAIVASMQPRAGGEEGWSAGMGLEFLVPVIVEVRGRALQRKITLNEIGLRFQPQTEEANPASLVNLVIENAGMTYSRLEVIARISKKMGGHWRRITEVKIPSEGDLGIIPGVTLNLEADVGRPLPQGEYQLQGFLAVDGRRADQLDKEVIFNGDLRAPLDLYTDAALDIEPLESEISTSPGRIGMTNLGIFNASEETVVVDISSTLPEHMAAATLPPDDQGRILRGEHFNCTPWLSFQPSQFTLKGYQRQYVMVKCDMPGNGAVLPEYFALLKLHAKFPDGQDGGTTKGRLYVQNNRVQAAPRVQVQQLNISGEAAVGARYFVVAQTANLGDVRIMPRCRAVVRTPMPEDLELDRFEMTSETYGQYGPMLPMEKRMFSGVLDISMLDPGRYRLAVVMDHDKPGGNDQRHKAFEVIEQGGIKSIRELDMDAVGGVVEVRL